MMMRFVEEVPIVESSSEVLVLQEMNVLALMKVTVSHMSVETFAENEVKEMAKRDTFP